MNSFDKNRFGGGGGTYEVYNFYNVFVILQRYLVFFTEPTMIYHNIVFVSSIMFMHVASKD